MLFLSDLDRTLIFSYKRLTEDNICVEEKESKKLSFMTPLSAGLLWEISEKVTFIPITTRSIEQYERISFPSGMPRLAVCDNGGNLLVNGVPDPIWRKRAEEHILPAMAEMERIKSYWESLPDVYFEVRLVDGTFIFTKSHIPLETLRLTAEKLCPEKVDLFDNGDKIYAVPKGINKGAALLWLKEMYGEEMIAAGDSLFDIEMLRNADIAIIKQGELTGERLNNIQYSEEGDDPDFTLLTVRKILEERGIL
ncbi:MAG: HAD family hydrolase [Huintestinicola sp.]|uniref:HAD family hydrolase n=1 Tax=Huintestinicola sp. TaxID=2981661 RepID=UPI003F010B8C